MDDKFDAPLLGILQNCGELEPFLEVVLGFLYRKTDFFRPLSSDQSMGFPPGVAREKLLKVYKKYECMGSPATVPRSPPSNNHPPTPPATPGLPSITPRPTVTPNVTAGELLPKPELKQEAMEQIQGDWSTSSWDHHNGGVTEHYAWSQTATDVDLKLVLPNPNIKASDLKIDIKPYNLKVQLKQQSDLQTLLEEKLHSLVKPEESMWSLHKGECLQINLEKGRDGYWWTGMFEGGHAIKLDTIDTTRHMHEFGQDERACVQKLMFDQQQKRLGQPSSDELNTEEILKKAWNTEGSPFAGTEYDRSKINLSNNPPPGPSGT